MRKFLDTVFKSIWNPHFYETIPSKSLGMSFKYMSKLLLLTSFLSALILSAVVTPFSKEFNFRVADFLKNKYPTDLEVSIKDGLIETNSSQVYVLDFPEEIFGSVAVDFIRKDTGLSNFLVLDTVSPMEDLLNIEKMNSLIFLTKDRAVFKDGKNGKMTVQSLKEFPNILINKQIVDSYSDRIKQYFAPLMVFFGIMGFLALFVFSLIKYFITALIAGLLIWFIAKISKHDEKYWLCFRYAVYGITLPVILGFVFFALAMPMQMHLISASLLSALIVVANRRAKKTV
jgi:hypothetical protein